MAIVIDGLNPENIGKITRVGRFLGERGYFGDYFNKYRTWEVETEMIDVGGNPNYTQTEDNLARIPDIDDKDTTKESEDEFSHA